MCVVVLLKYSFLVVILNLIPSISLAPGDTWHDSCLPPWPGPHPIGDLDTHQWCSFVQSQRRLFPRHARRRGGNIKNNLMLRLLPPVFLALLPVSARCRYSFTAIGTRFKVDISPVFCMKAGVCSLWFYRRTSSVLLKLLFDAVPVSLFIVV